MSDVDIDGLSVSQLHAYLREAGADTSGCCEKVRVRHRVHCRAMAGSPPSPRLREVEKKGPVERHSLRLQRRSHPSLRQIKAPYITHFSPSLNAGVLEGRDAVIVHESAHAACDP